MLQNTIPIDDTLSIDEGEVQEIKTIKGNNVVDLIKNRIDIINPGKFSGTPIHLEELLESGNKLGIVVMTNLIEGSMTEYENKSYLLLNDNVKVYFDIDINSIGNIEEIYIYSGKSKQQISQKRTPKLYEHFVNNVVKYKNGKN